MIVSVPADWAMSTTAAPIDQRPLSRLDETTPWASSVCRIRHAVARFSPHVSASRAAVESSGAARATARSSSIARSTDCTRGIRSADVGSSMVKPPATP
jgi:hypothetical protein